MLMGEFDLDPCSNPRSHIRATLSLTLEHGDDGLDDGRGCYRVGEPGPEWVGYYGCAKDGARIFVNPPYARGQVARWVQHYCRTDFTFLLRWDPSTDWFATLIPFCRYVWFPNRRINFEPPPGVKSSSNPFPHALYMRSRPNAELRAAGYTLEMSN